MQHTHTLILDESLFLAQGSGRRVYRHPDQSATIIKIQKPLKVKRFKTLRKLINRHKRRFSSILFSWVEIDEFAAMVARTQHVPQFCSQFRGFVETDKGVGSMFDMILGPDGNIAPTLAQFAAQHPHNETITNAIDALWDDIMYFRALVWDPHFTNVLVAGSLDDGLRLVIVDGLGDRAFVPIKSWSDVVQKKHCEAMRAEMHQKYAEASQKSKSN